MHELKKAIEGVFAAYETDAVFEPDAMEGTGKAIDELYEVYKQVKDNL